MCVHGICFYIKSGVVQFISNKILILQEQTAKTIVHLPVALVQTSRGHPALPGMIQMRF